MNRKDFIKGSCGVCMALGSGFLMSAVLEACKTPLGVIKTAANNNVVAIPLTEFAASDYKLIRLRNYDYDLAVQKNKDGTYETLILMCTHASNPLTKTGNGYYCTLHGSAFDREGHVTKGPAEKNMIKLNTTIKNDQILIQLKQLS
ncbi:MAG: Rieske (2Fe-2S) protein [Flavipsychrobacter sp.]|nr:Rieske (2Fe-2S) protein [Flavipsychrobacter sp.]